MLIYEISFKNKLVLENRVKIDLKMECFKSQLKH